MTNNKLTMKKHVKSTVSVSMKTKQRCVMGVAIMLFAFSAHNTFALDMLPSDPRYYYRFDGGSDISIPAATEHRSLTVGGDINTDLGFDCASFNPAISIANTFKHMKNSATGIAQDIAASATGAVATLPMYMLEKASPELYNYLQTTLTMAQERFDLSMKGCEVVMQQIQQGKSPYQDWFSIADSQGWLQKAKQAKQGQPVDINNVKKDIARNPHQYGVPWVHKGQNAGGAIGNQPPIRVMYDVVVAGYNVMVNPKRPLDAKTPAPASSELTRYWETPDAAGKWATLVLGDITISANHNEPTHPGVGLATLMRTCPEIQSVQSTCVKTLIQQFTDLVKNQSAPTAEALVKVSSGETLITPSVIQALKNLNPEAQHIAMSKLSEDVALQNLVDEALLLRRILLASTRINAIANLKPALTIIHQALKTLDTDLNNLLFEHRIRKQLLTETVQRVLNGQTGQQVNAVNRQGRDSAPLLHHGARYQFTDNGDNTP